MRALAVERTKEASGMGSRPARVGVRAARMRTCLLRPLAAMGLLLLLASCSSNSGAAAPTTTTSGAATTTAPAQTTPGDQATATPALTPITTPGGQIGGSAFCAQPVASGSTPPPATIPAYPTAQLRFGRTENGFGLYGLCTADLIATVAQFYATQLPSKGWTQVQTSSLANVQQISATRGSAHLTLTIEQDPQVTAQNEIIIQTIGL